MRALNINRVKKHSEPRDFSEASPVSVHELFVVEAKPYNADDVCDIQRAECEYV